jgi:hypothetical protein
MKRAKPVLEQGINPKKRTRSVTEFDFENMKPGESFYYEGSRNSAIVPFVYRVASGYYRTEKDGNGWRFFLKKKLPNK